MLKALFLKIEIEIVTKDNNELKSLRPNGLNLAFFKEFKNLMNGKVRSSLINFVDQSGVASYLSNIFLKINSP